MTNISIELVVLKIPDKPTLFFSLPFLIRGFKLYVKIVTGFVFLSLRILFEILKYSNDNKKLLFYENVS